MVLSFLRQEQHCTHMHHKETFTNMEESFEKPPKLRRLEPPVTMRELQERVLQLAIVPLSGYYGTSNPNAVDDFFIGFSNLLQNINSSDIGDDNARLMAQVHGMLLQWLDYIATQQPPRDITTEDDIAMAKVTTSVAHITCCLKDVYRCFPNLYDLEGLVILVRALLMTTARSIDVQSFQPPQLPILGLLQSMVAHTNADQLPGSFKQQLALILLEALSHQEQENQSCSISPIGRLDQSPLVISGTSSAVIRTILSHLASRRWTKEATYGISNIAHIALSMLTCSRDELEKYFCEDHLNAWAIDPMGLFRLQCAIRLKAISSHGVVALVPIVKTVLDATSPTDCRFQAMDCLVTLTGQISQQQDKQLLSHFMQAPLLEAVIHIMSTTNARLPTTPIDGMIKFLAMDGLRRLLSNCGALEASLRALERPQQARQFLSSLVEVACSNRRQYYPTSDADGDDWYDVIFRCHHVDNAVEMAAAETVLSILQAMSMSRADDHIQLLAVPSADVAAVCHSLLSCDCEHVTYLTVRTICSTDTSTKTTLFLDIMELHPELLSAMALVLQNDHRKHAAMPQTRERILQFWSHLLQVRPLLLPVMARQEGVLEALAAVSAVLHGTSSTTMTTTPTMRQLAAGILLELGVHVCNRRLLARTHRVLACLIRYARELPRDDDGNSTATTAEPVVSPQSYCRHHHRELVKERILQLAQVL